MLTEEYRDLIEKLLVRTEAGSVNWHPTSDENEFVVYFEQFSLSIRMYREERDPDSCSFTIRGSTGKVVDRFWLEHANEDWALADRIFAAARRKALRVDEALETILLELDKESVGLSKDPTKQPEPEDDDIPF